jgi:hypothetical protein
VTTKDFPTADVLSVTTGKLLSDCGMDGLIDLIAWVTHENPPPAPDGKFEVRWLLTAAAKARDLLIWQHPWLLEAQPPAGVDNSRLLDWLLAVEKQRGAVLTVGREDKLGGVVLGLRATVNSAKRALIELAAALSKPLPEDA